MSQKRNENQQQSDNKKSQKRHLSLWLQGGRIGLIISIITVLIYPTNQYVREAFLSICQPALYLISFISDSEITFHLSGLAIFLSYFLAGSMIGAIIQIGKMYITKRRSS